MGKQTYLVALGGNVRTRWGRPRETLAAFLRGRHEGYAVRATSRIVASMPVGHGRRRFANAVAIVDSELPPPALLAALKRSERAHGRRGGRRWGDRTLDLDIVAWSGGRWRSPRLTIPHTAIERRRFVLRPMVDIAPDWRLPDGRWPRHLLAWLGKARRQT